MIHLTSHACSTDGLDAVERKGFFATHRGLLELPQVWEAVLDFVDIPVEDSAAGTAESSAETFPMSHSISPVLGTRPAAKVPGASQHNTARTRRHAQLRTEAHARSKEHRQVLFRAVVCEFHVELDGCFSACQHGHMNACHAMPRLCFT